MSCICVFWCRRMAAVREPELKQINNQSIMNQSKICKILKILYPRKQLALRYTINQLHSKPPFHDIVNNTEVLIYYHTSYLAHANGTAINILETHCDACCDKVIYLSVLRMCTNMWLRWFHTDY